MKLQFLKNKNMKLKCKIAIVMNIIVVISTFAGGVDKNGETSSLLKFTNVPIELQQFVDDYLKDSTCYFGLNAVKNQYRKSGILDSTILITDLTADKPIRICNLDRIKILSDENVKTVSEVVRPIDSWYVAIRGNGKVIYVIEILSHDAHTFHIISTSAVYSKNYEAAAHFWPIDYGFIPIFINDHPFFYFHFPQVDDCNLLPLTMDMDDDTVFSDDEIIESHKTKKITNWNSALTSPFSGAYLSPCQWGFNRLRRLYKRIEDGKKAFEKKYKEKMEMDKKKKN